MSELQEYEMNAINHWHGMQMVADRLEELDRSSNHQSQEQFDRIRRTQKRASRLWGGLTVVEMNYILDNADQYL
jgi:hypothetical protein